VRLSGWVPAHVRRASDGKWSAVATANVSVPVHARYPAVVGRPRAPRGDPVGPKPA